MKRYIKRRIIKIMKCIILEDVCICFALVNVLLKTLLTVIAIVSSDTTMDTLVSLGGTSRSERDEEIVLHMYGYMSIMRMILVGDCLISILYSVILIVGVRRRSVRLLKMCLVYGYVVLFLSIISTVPRFIQMILEQEFQFFWRKINALKLTVLSSIQVLMVYKTWRKFQKISKPRLVAKKYEEKRDEHPIIYDTKL